MGLFKGVKNFAFSVIARFIMDDVIDDLDKRMDKARDRIIQRAQEKLIRLEQRIEQREAEGEIAVWAIIRARALEYWLENRMTEEEWQAFQDFLFNLVDDVVGDVID